MAGLEETMVRAGHTRGHENPEKERGAESLVSGRIDASSLAMASPSSVVVLQFPR